MKREHGLVQHEVHSDWDSDPGVEVPDPCTSKRMMRVATPIKKKVRTETEQQPHPLSAPVKKPVSSEKLRALVLNLIESKYQLHQLYQRNPHRCLQI